MLLTISIPTYNRIEFLKELLPEMVKQCKPYPEVEILIRDNDSRDGTWSYIRDIERENTNVRAEMNLENVGGDENFVRCVEMARGKYVWLFGDDELLCENGVANVVSMLKEYPPPLLIMLCCGVTETRNLFWYGKYSEFIKTASPMTIIHHTLITCNIFRKSSFDTRVARSRSKNLNGSYSHIYAITGDLMGSEGLVVRTNVPSFKPRPVRAPFKQHLKFIRMKWIHLLLYLGVPYHKIVRFAIVDLAFASAMRQIHKLGGAA